MPPSIDLSTFTSTLPIVVVLSDTPLIGTQGEHVACQLYVASGQNLNALSSIANQSGRSASLHVRGAATKNMTKQQFGVHLADAEASDAFIGLPMTGDKWVFNDCGSVDRSYVRNALAFHLQRSLPAAGWAPHTQHFELFAADAATYPQLDPNHPATFFALGEVTLDAPPTCIYRGLYLLEEKIEAGSARVPIPTDVPADPSPNMLGGFIVQCNHPSADYETLSPTPANIGDQEVLLYEPQKEYFDPIEHSGQWDVVQSWWKRWVEPYLYYVAPSEPPPPALPPPPPPAAPPSPADLAAIEASTDLASFAAYFLLAEIAKDPDGYHRSTFMYGALDVPTMTMVMHAGPMWDKNKSFGNPDLDYAADYKSPTGWGYRPAPEPNQAPGWWWVLLATEPFCDQVYSLWQRAREQSPDGQGWTWAAVESYLNDLKATLTRSSPSLESPAWRDSELYYPGTFSTWQSKQYEVLTTYLQQRMEWMDAHLQAMLQENCPTWSPT